MNRVWKRFLLKVGKVVAVIVGLILYVTVLAALLSMFGVNPRLASFLIFAVGFGAPMVGFMLYTTYKDAEYEVRRENEDLLRKIKG